MDEQPWGNAEIIPLSLDPFCPTCEVALTVPPEGEDTGAEGVAYNGYKVDYCISMCPQCKKKYVEVMFE